MGWMMHETPAEEEIERLTKDLNDDSRVSVFKQLFFPDPDCFWRFAVFDRRLVLRGLGASLLGSCWFTTVLGLLTAPPISLAIRPMNLMTTPRTAGGSHC